jgi:hypothetical protein
MSELHTLCFAKIFATCGARQWKEKAQPEG